MTTFPTPVPMLAASLVLGLAAELRAEPVDLSNPTPRTVRVEFEVSPHPEELGLVWSAPFDASFSVSGDRAVIVVDSADYEDFLATYGGVGGFVPIPGSWFPFVLMIDRADLDADGYGLGQVVFPPGGGGGGAQVGRSIQTYGFTGLAGWFEFSPGSGQYLACPGPLPFATCHPVTSSAYDSATGLLNAPGRDTFTHSDIPPGFFPLFGTHGELRLSEAVTAVPALPVAWWIALAAALVLVGLAATATPRLALRARGAARARPGSRR